MHADVYTDYDFNIDIFTDEKHNLYYMNVDDNELHKFAHYAILIPSGMFEIYMNGRFNKFDDLAMLAYEFLRSDDMEW